MSRLFALLAVLVAGAAAAQPEPPPPPVESAPEDVNLSGSAQARSASLSEETAANARYSDFSAGPGGVWFIVTQGVVGLFGGALVGAVRGAQSRELYPWMFGGGLLLGAASGIFQYIHPIGRAAAGASALGAAAGLSAGMGLVVATGTQAPLPVAALLVAGMEVGALAPILLSWAEPDLRRSSAALMGSGASYALALTTLSVLYLRGSGNLINPAVPLLVAPAAGMLVGGVLGAFLDPHPVDVFKLTAIPLGACAALVGYGLILQVPMHKVAVASGVGMAAALALTVVLYETEVEEPAPLPARAAVSRWTVTPGVLGAPGTGAAVPGAFVSGAFD